MNKQELVRFVQEKPQPTEEELQEAARRYLPQAQELADMLARIRPSKDEFSEAYTRVLERAIGSTLSQLATDHIIETLDEMLPDAIEKILAGEWEVHANGKRFKERMESLVVRKLEEAVQASVARGYTVQVDVRFERVRP